MGVRTVYGMKPAFELGVVGKPEFKVTLTNCPICIVLTVSSQRGKGKLIEEAAVWETVNIRENLWAFDLSEFNTNLGFDVCSDLLYECPPRSSFRPNIVLGYGYFLNR